MLEELYIEIEEKDRDRTHLIVAKTGKTVSCELLLLNLPDVLLETGLIPIRKN